MQYPIAFLTSKGVIFQMSKNKVSVDGTPRYIPNKKSDATYSLEDCLKSYTPIYK